MSKRPFLPHLQAVGNIKANRNSYAVRFLIKYGIIFRRIAILIGNYHQPTTSAPGLPSEFNFGRE